MLKVKPFKQSKGFCGPACLKMALSHYGINRSESYLAKLTKTSRIKGCYEKDIIRAARKFGLKGFFKQKSSIGELKALILLDKPVIVDWFSPEEKGHYSLVVGFKDKNIFLADPHFGKIKKHDIEWFEKRWYDLVDGKTIRKEIIVLHR